MVHRPQIAAADGGAERLAWNTLFQPSLGLNNRKDLRRRQAGLLRDAALRTLKTWNICPRS